MAKTSFIFLLLLVASFFDAAEANSCSWGNFYCSRSSQCKSSQWRCDGDRDCTYGEDELNCRTACPSRSSYFRCNNYKCISRSHVCDGDNDCGDYSDESSFLCGVRRSSSRLRCYSCSSYSSTCYSYMTCPSYYNGQGYCYRKTYDRTSGSTSRVTVAGCRSSCTSYDRAIACRNQRNCQMTCCTTPLCNTGSSSGGSSSYPSCYTCSSSSSYEDCEKRATLRRCSSSSASCYKMNYETSFIVKVKVYSKGCTIGSSSCSTVRSTYCSMKDKCKVYCCTGSKCNAGSVQRFSIIALLTCAVAFFIF